MQTTKKATIPPTVIVFDTLCTGWQTVIDDVYEPAIYTDPDELAEDLEFFGGDPMTLAEFEEQGGVGRKAIFTGSAAQS